MSNLREQQRQAIVARRVVNKVKGFFKILGPGFVTGAADDDPSGIANFSQAGAQYGLKLLWLAPFVFPLMVCIQEMSARIGLVTRRGIITIIKEEYPPLALWLVGLLALPATTINVGSDLLAMGAVSHMLLPQVSTVVFSVIAGILVLALLFLLNYNRVTSVLKWAACVLVLYFFVPFFVKQDWGLVLRSLVTPHLQFEPAFLGTLGAFIGTNISVYLFFWESSTFVEDQQHKYGHLFNDPEAELPDLMREVKTMQKDNAFGMAITGTIMFFVVWACGSTLFTKGITDINTVDQAAEALRPIAGEAAYLLFAVGILASGLIAVPVLAGSCGYIAAEAFGCPRGMDKKLPEAKVFYAVIFLSVALSLLINLTGIGAVQALIFSATVYGIIAPPTIFYIMNICNNPRIMGRFTNNIWSNIVGYF
ncbi:MAG: Nramp family divalent metal transporter, partial [Chroococcidiopsidaceae cyanobacterium CP_BM_RX_35]|nr:Nramp family divalent metal transporter [Chroococcidiopsidaceae cyanobacterium CP_BM_RX_35]